MAARACSSFPTSMGRFFEWEDRGMIGALGEHLERGWLQLYCVDSVDDDSWYAKWKHPATARARHAQYDAICATRCCRSRAQLNDNPFLMTTGASFGAYHAMTFALRYPHLVGPRDRAERAVRHPRADRRLLGRHVYFNNPADFILGEHDPGRLAALRRMDIILAIGRDDPMRGDNEDFSRRLWSKGIWHALRIWDGWAHDWPYWQRDDSHVHRRTRLTWERDDDGASQGEADRI